MEAGKYKQNPDKSTDSCCESLHLERLLIVLSNTEEGLKNERGRCDVGRDL